MKTVTVAAPLCSPARSHVATMRNYLDRYEFEGYKVDATARKEYMEIKVQFSDGSAEWGEYCIGTLGKYDHIGPWLDPKNEARVGRRLRPSEGTWHDGTCKGIKGDVKGLPIGATGNPPIPWKDRARQAVSNQQPQRRQPAKPQRKPKPQRKRRRSILDWFDL